MFIAALSKVARTGSNLMSINRRTTKEDVKHVYDGMILSHKRNEIGLFVETWIDLETVIQSEVRKRKVSNVY